MTITTIIPVLLLLLLAGLAKAVADTLQFHYRDSIFPQAATTRLLGLTRAWYDPAQSWRNKYRSYPEDQRPAFPGAKGPLVFLTDAWHFAQMVMLSALQLAALLPLVQLYGLPWWWVVVGLAIAKVLFGGAFEAAYQRYLIRKPPDVTAMQPDSNT